MTCIAIVTWASHTSKRHSENRPLFPSSLFRRQIATRLRLAARHGFGGFYIWWERVWSMKRGWRVVGSDALRLGNWEFQWLVRDCGQISGRSFFTRPSRKSRTKIRQRVAIKCDAQTWSPVVPWKAEAAALHIVEFELITTTSRGPSKLWVGEASCAVL